MVAARYQTNPVILAVIENLRAAGLAVGDGEAPLGVGWQDAPANSLFVAYCVVHGFSKRFDGSIDDPFDDGSPTISISSYGLDREQATQTADTAHTSLTTNPVTIPGRHVMIVEPLDDSATDRLDDVRPAMWQDVQRIRVHTTALT